MWKRILVRKLRFMGVREEININVRMKYLIDQVNDIVGSILVYLIKVKKMNRKDG